MFVVIADGKPVFSTDIDDVAWDQSQELEDEYDNIFVEEMYIKDFDAQGNYTTDEGYIISLQEIANSEQFFEDTTEIRKIKKKIGQNKPKKVSRKYWKEEVDSLCINGVARLLDKLNISYDSSADEMKLKDILSSQLKKILRKDDEFTESIFRELADCSYLSMRIWQLGGLGSGEEHRAMVSNMLNKIYLSVDADIDETEMELLLFDGLYKCADESGKNPIELFNEYKENC